MIQEFFHGRSESSSVLHAFAPGKEMVMGYYRYLGVPHHMAWELVHGKHKDTPFEQLNLGYLPGPNSRYFMEKMGYFLGNECGYPSEFTLNAEVQRHFRKQTETGIDFHLIMESLVYEVDTWRQLGGVVIKVESEVYGQDIEAQQTDIGVDAIVPDYTLVNNGSLDALNTRVLKLMDRICYPEQSS
jgi:hypothetical protein